MNAALVEMFEYNRWANRTLMDFCRTLDDAALDAVVPEASGTVRVLLMHLAGSQRTFLLRTQGRQHEGELNRRSEWPGFDAVASELEETSTRMIEVAANLDGDANVDLPYVGRVFRFPVRFFLTHEMAHSTEHRTEIKMALGHLGIATPDLDAWNYAAAMGYGEEVD